MFALAQALLEAIGRLVADLIGGLAGTLWGHRSPDMPAIRMLLVLALAFLIWINWGTLARLAN